MKFKICKFDELTVMEMYEIARSRFEVFAMEQKIIQEPELDGVDKDCYQVFYMDNGRVIAYCRIVPAGIAYDNISLGRVLVLNDYRRKGLAQIMIKEALKFIKEELFINKKIFILKTFKNVDFFETHIRKLYFYTIYK